MEEKKLLSDAAEHLQAMMDSYLKAKHHQFMMNITKDYQISSVKVEPKFNMIEINCNILVSLNQAKELGKKIAESLV